jgi:hypothetical protein
VRRKGEGNTYRRMYRIRSEIVKIRGMQRSSRQQARPDACDAVHVARGPRAARRRRSCWGTRNRAVAAPPSGQETVWVVVELNTETLASRTSSNDALA